MFEKLIIGAFVLLILGRHFIDAQFVNLTQHPGELCNSKCVKGQHRICYFEWTLELYQAMGTACGKCEQGVKSDCFNPQCIIGDGFQKGVMSINRMIPGPPLHVCEGDQVVIDVKNMAVGTAASIHWHGLHMKDTPYMDGAPYATQCPILFGSTFRYQFTATQPGTHFYQSQSGIHKLDGIYGALIVGQSDDKNLQISEYDYDLPEHYIFISDWTHAYGENSFPGISSHQTFPDSLLINGRGTYVNKTTFEHNQVPVTVFYVKPGKKYRFRVIDGMSLPDIAQVQIEKHSMFVIATDSYDVKPLPIDTLLMNAGERFDIVINTNNTEGDFWFRIRGAYKFPPQPTDTFALLRYVTNDSDYDKPQPPFPDYNDTFPIGIRLNHPQATCSVEDSEFCVVNLKNLVKDNNLLTSKPDYKLILSYYSYEFPKEKRFVPGEYKRFTNPKDDVIQNGVMNNISLIFPPQPILTQYSEIDKNKFCKKSQCPEKCKGEPTRECVHIIKIKSNSIVEMVIHDQLNQPGMDHPFHMHGYRLALIGISNDSSNLTEAIEYASRYRKNGAVWKDTVSIPRHGLVVVRFRADNPGIWLLHCQYELQLLTGMGVILQIGEPDEWVEAPEHFPKCGNFMPRVKKNIK